MKRVYIAGAYSGPDVITIQGNCRRGLRTSYDVLKHGMAPFCPWLDWYFGMMGPVMLEEYYAYSMQWLMVSDAVFVVAENAETSVGTQAEIAMAEKHGIPVFRDFQKLCAWRDEA